MFNDGAALDAELDAEAPSSVPSPIEADGEGYSIELSGSARQYFDVRLQSLGGLAHVAGTLVRRTKKGVECRPMTIVMRDGDALALCVCLANEYGLRLEPYLPKTQSERPSSASPDRSRD